MPSYELMVVLKKLARPDLVGALKRVSSLIYRSNGYLFDIQNLGTRPLPFKIRSHKAWNTEASYFLIQFDSPAKAVAFLGDEYKRDVDILRHSFVTIKNAPRIECTLEEEMQPPAYRADVQQLMKTGKQKERRWNPKTGLTYNPFRT